MADQSHLGTLDRTMRGAPKRTVLQALAWGTVIAVLVWAWRGAEMRPMLLVKDSGNMLKFAIDFFPPDFRDWKYYIEQMAVTIQIAIWGTLLAMVLAVPFGLLASKNVAPWWLYQPVRRALDAARAINEMMFAMLFVVVVGMGPFAGVLALFVHTTGILAKLFSEAVEAIDPRPVEGIRVTGASAIEEITFGIIPQVLPLWVSYSLYRFESNVRSASVVGMVGAGGVGMVLWEIIQGFQFRQTCAVILIVIATCSLIDMGSAHVRKVMV
ncbi:MAG: phosphonate ABC transporter, permease protein PhnE [Candidatus Korobacteraceae bacterium]